MLDRFKRNDGHGETAVADRPVTHTNGSVTADSREHMRSVVRASARSSGGQLGRRFFGWLVAVGLGALLVGLLAAAGAAVGLTDLAADDTVGMRSKSASEARSRCWPRSASRTSAAATSPAGCRASTAPARASARG